MLMLRLKNTVSCERGKIAGCEIVTYGGFMKRKLSKRQKLSAERAKVVERIIRQVWSSLESHLSHTYLPIKNHNLDGTNNFQKRCVREYAEIINMLTYLY